VINVGEAKRDRPGQMGGAPVLPPRDERSGPELEGSMPPPEKPFRPVNPCSSIRARR